MTSLHILFHTRSIHHLTFKSNFFRKCQLFHYDIILPVIRHLSWAHFFSLRYSIMLGANFVEKRQVPYHPNSLDRDNYLFLVSLANIFWENNFMLFRTPSEDLHIAAKFVPVLSRLSESRCYTVTKKFNWMRDYPHYGHWLADRHNMIFAMTWSRYISFTGFWPTD